MTARNLSGGIGEPAAAKSAGLSGSAGPFGSAGSSDSDALSGPAPVSGRKRAFALSILDLATIGANSNASAALRTTVELARRAEAWGYTRFWLAEHHGMPSIASSSPEVLMAHVAAATKTIRIGAGGIMLPNHAPLRVAEAFHTLEALHPGRIDLGIGRAPGTDPATSAALRPFDASQFPAQLQELVALSEGSFPPGHPFHGVRVVPDDVELPPIWLLGSSGASAALAGKWGFGYGFASHFSHTPPGPALEAYRSNFEPASRPGRSEPHVILGATVICAPTDEEADWLAKTMDLAWVRIRQGARGRLPSPEEGATYDYSPEERIVVEQYRRLAVIGGPDTVRERLAAIVEETGADEIMVSTMIWDPQARLRSYELIAAACL